MEIKEEDINLLLGKRKWEKTISNEKTQRKEEYRSLLFWFNFLFFCNVFFLLRQKPLLIWLGLEKKMITKRHVHSNFPSLLRLFPKMIKTIKESKKTKQTVLETKQNISVLSLFVALSDFFLTKTLK